MVTTLSLVRTTLATGTAGTTAWFPPARAGARQGDDGTNRFVLAGL